MSTSQKIIADLAGEVAVHDAELKASLRPQTEDVVLFYGESNFVALVVVEDPESWGLHVSVQNNVGVNFGTMDFSNIDLETVARAIVSAIDKGRL